MNMLKRIWWFTKRSRLQSIQDGNLVEVVWWKKDKLENVKLQILDGFSSEWMLLYLHSKSPFLQVTFNFEFK